MKFIPKRATKRQAKRRSSSRRVASIHNKEWESKDISCPFERGLFDGWIPSVILIPAIEPSNLSTAEPDDKQAFVLDEQVKFKSKELYMSFVRNNDIRKSFSGAQNMSDKAMDEAVASMGKLVLKGNACFEPREVESCLRRKG